MVALQEGTEVHRVTVRHEVREHVRVGVLRHRADRELVRKHPQHAALVLHVVDASWMQRARPHLARQQAKGRSHKSLRTREHRRQYSLTLRPLAAIIGIRCVFRTDSDTNIAKWSSCVAFLDP